MVRRASHHSSSPCAVLTCTVVVPKLFTQPLLFTLTFTSHTHTHYLISINITEIKEPKDYYNYCYTVPDSDWDLMSRPLGLNFNCVEIFPLFPIFLILFFLYPSFIRFPFSGRACSHSALQCLFTFKVLVFKLA